MSALSLEDWHRRFVTQAGWTREVQTSVFGSRVLTSGSRVLEVGCGTGALIDALAGSYPVRYTGVDLNLSRLRFAHPRLPMVGFAAADGAHLPYKSGQFQAAVCHYLLLWVGDPLAVLREMARVTAPGGSVAALAEPDYAGRIDHPAPLDELGRLQRQALIKQGADPDLGRRLPALLNAAGLVNVSAGILGARWQADWEEADFASEWSLLEDDLAGTLPPDRMDAFKAADEAARRRGERVLFVPTFYAAAEVPPLG